MKNEHAPDIVETEAEFERTEIAVERPRGDRDMYRISFEGKNSLQSRAYNRAIDVICMDHLVSVVPHFTDGNPESAGYHVWEVTTAATSELLEKLVPEIHAKAEEVFNRWQKARRLQENK